MSRRFNIDARTFRHGLRIRSSGTRLPAAVVVIVAFSLLYCTSARHDDAIAAPEDGNPPIPVKLRPPQLHPPHSRTSDDQPYPGLQIVARQKIAPVTSPVIRPRTDHPGEQRIGRSRAVFTTPPLTIQQPARRIPTQVRRPSTGSVTGGVDSPGVHVRKQTNSEESPWARKIPPQAKTDRTSDIREEPRDVLSAYRTRQLLQEAEDALRAGNTAVARSRAIQARSLAASRGSQGDQSAAGIDRSRENTTQPGTVPVKTISVQKVLEALPALNHPDVAAATSADAAEQNTLSRSLVPLSARELRSGSSKADAAATSDDESNQDHDIKPQEPVAESRKKPIAAPTPEASTVEPLTAASSSPPTAENSETLRLTLPAGRDQENSSATQPADVSPEPAAADKTTIPDVTELPAAPQTHRKRSSVPHHSFQDVDLPASVPVKQQSGSHWGHSYIGPTPGTSGYRATIEQDADFWMSPYAARADKAAGSPALSVIIPPLSELPPGFRPWWDATVRKSTGLAKTSVNVDVSKLLQDAMLYSPQVTALQTEPEVQYRVVTQESAKFDWTAFLEATYDDLNDPIGNTLTTANGATRLLTRKAVGTSGVRQKNLHGGELRIAQNIGHENQNSSFFVPNNQGTARFELSYRQPLLDGAGRTYNESEIVLARIQANSSEDEVADALQVHLIKVTEAYWTLYRARAEFLQRQKLFRSSREVLTTLEGRNQVDTIPRQILRAKAAVARSQTGIQRTVARVRDAEAQLRLLVNSPEMLNGGPTELTPIEAPGMVTENAELRGVLHTALVNRPDISEAIRKMRASGVRLGVSRTELLPRLDFLVESYVSDLTGGSNVGRSYRDQFRDNRPGVTVGLEFEIPLGNRAAQAKYEQRQWELKRSVSVFRATVEKSLTDVEIANREVATAYSEMQSRFQAMSAAENETAYLRDRFEVLPMVEDSATLLLEDLLDSFERLADEEAGFVQALVDHAVALVKLKKELGVLLRSRNSSPSIESSEQQWMSDRLDAAVDGRAADSGSGNFSDKSNDLPVEANVPRTLTPEKSTEISRSEEADVPEISDTGRNPVTKPNGAQAAPPTKPGRVGGHTF